MNRSRAILFGFLVAALGGLAVVAWLLAGHGEPEAGSGRLLSAQRSEDMRAILPSAEAATPETLAAAEGEPGAASEAAGGADGSAADTSPLKQRSVAGRVLMEDGSALPKGLAVFASLSCPPPVLFTMRDVVGGQEKSAGLLGYGEDSTDFAGDDVAQASLVEPTSDGRFEMKVPGTDVWLGVRSEGMCLVAPVHVPADATSEVELILALGGVIEGRVLDAQERPMAGALVRGATPFDPYGMLDSASRMASLGTVRTDDAGHFLFPQVPTGVGMQVLARVATEEDGDEALPGPEHQHGDQDNFTLRRMITHEAEELKAAADEPAPEKPAHGSSLQPAQVEVPALKPGERRTIQLVLQPAGAIRGVVVRADGTPLAGAKVTLRRTSLLLKDISMGDGGGLGDDTRTAEDGRFEFPSVADGLYETLLAESGWRFARASNLRITPGTVIEDIELLAEEGLTVSGHVFDRNGQPLEDADVDGFPPPSLMSFGAAFERGVRPDTETDAAGAFRLAGFDEGKVRIRAKAKGFRAQQVDVLAGDSGVELRLEPLAALSGIVVSLVDGEPVTTFRVGLTPSEGLFQPGDMFGTDAEAGFEKMVAPRRFSGREDGTFTLEDVTPGDYDVRVTADGFGALVEKGLEVGEDGRRGLVIMLEPECSVFGQVVDGRAGLPVSGASVRTTKGGGIAEMMESMVQPGPATRTDGQGHFRLAGLSAGGVRLSIEHQRFRTLGVPDIVLQAGEAHDLGVLRLSAGASVYGTVTDALGPVADVSVMVSNAIGSTLKRTSSDAQGHYRVEGLPPGTYNVMRMDFSFDIGGDASPLDMLKDLTFESVTLAEEEERRVDLRVRAEGGVKLFGKVSDAGGPVPGAMMTLLPDSEGARVAFSTTGKDGEYEFKQMPAGRYSLQVVPMDSMMGQSQGQPGSPIFATLQIGALPEQRHDVSLPGGVLNGVVVSADDGHTVSGVRVVLERTDEGARETSFVVAMGGRVGETFADDAGAFRFRHLPGGTYAVVAGGQNILGMGASGWAATRVEDLSVAESSSGFTVKVEVEPAAVVAGTVRDTGGRPLSGTGVWVLDESGTPRSVFSEVVSEDDGRYEIGDLPTGAWTLAFMDGDHALTLKRGVVVHVGERTALDVTLPPGVPVRVNLAGRSAASLSVSVSGPDGWLPTRLVSLSDLASLPQASGTLSVGTYAAGNYQVQVLSGSEVLFNSTVTLVAGAGSTVLGLPSP